MNDKSNKAEGKKSVRLRRPGFAGQASRPDEWVALLDKNNILIGYDENPVEIKEGDILVPENCDLIPGRYKWSGEAFWPLGTKVKLMKEKLLRELPDCFYSLIKENPEIKIPSNVSEWIQEYDAILEKEKK